MLKEGTVIPQTKKRHSLRRLQSRMAELRRKHRQSLKSQGGQTRSNFPLPRAARRAAVRVTAAQNSSRRIPTRQEMQVEEDFQQSVRELGL